MKRIICILTTVIMVGCSAIPAKDRVRSDLSGKPLTADDFTVIVGDRVIKAFATKAEIGETFWGIQGVKKDIWQWSVLLPDSRGDENTTDYQTNEVRIVYFDHDHEGPNSYFGLKKGALTIRGIGLGSSLGQVVEAYGKNEWLDKYPEAMTKGDAGFVYRFYGYPESAKSKYPFFDYIYFEAKNGVVVGIHFWRKQSDAE